MPFEPLREGPTAKLITLGLGLIPGVGLPLAGAYQLARVGSSIYRNLNPPQSGYTGPNDLFGVGAPGGNPGGTPVANNATATGSDFVDPTDPNNPSNYHLGNPGSQSSSGGRYGANGGMVMNNTTFNSARQPFSASYQQLAMPGSAIGPLRGGASSYFRPGSFIPGSNAGPAGYASSNSGYVRSRNII